MNYSIKTYLYSAELAEAKAVHPLSEDRILVFDGQSIKIFTPDSNSLVTKLDWPEIRSDSWRNKLRPRFRVSTSGKLFALTNDYGQIGRVFNLESGVTLKLDRGDYHPDTQPFPIEFIQIGGRDLIIHASDWNRLEISDPATAEIITARDPMRYETDGKRHLHYLDYFHGKLYVSPDEKWIANDGWIWHPIGEISVWKIEDWLINPYESEDGESRKILCYRDYLWDVPMCWIGNSRFAVWGIGTDADAMLNGARIFDVEKNEEVNKFLGPSQNGFWSDGERLFSNEPEGVCIWNINSGVCTERVENFRIDFRIENKFVEIDGNCLRVLTFG